MLHQMRMGGRVEGRGRTDVSGAGRGGRRPGAVITVRRPPPYGGK